MILEFLQELAMNMLYKTAQGLRSLFAKTKRFLSQFPTDFGFETRARRMELVRAQSRSERREDQFWATTMPVDPRM